LAQVDKIAAYAFQASNFFSPFSRLPLLWRTSFEKIYAGDPSSGLYVWPELLHRGRSVVCSIWRLQLAIGLKEKVRGKDGGELRAIISRRTHMHRRTACLGGLRAVPGRDCLQSESHLGFV